MNCDPVSLMTAAKCFRCIPAGALTEVMTYLMCQWSNKSAAPKIPIDWVPAAKVATWNDVNGAHAGDLPAFLATANIPTVSQLLLSGAGITSITHVDYLPSLNHLDVAYNLLTTLDLTGCSSLQILVGGYQALATVNISGCNALQAVFFQYTNITSLDLSNRTSLTDVNTFGSAALASFKVTGCSSLQNITVSYCASLTALDITGCSSLISLTASACALASLDLSPAGGSLTGCFVGTNNISTLVVGAGNVNIVNLFCNNNPLTSLGANNSPALVNLNANTTALTNLDLLGCINLNSLDVSASAITSIDMLGCPATVVFVNNNPFAVVDISNLMCDIDATGVHNGTMHWAATNVLNAGGTVCKNNLTGKGWALTPP